MYRKEFSKVYSLADLIELVRNANSLLSEFVDSSHPVQLGFTATPTLDTAFLVTVANIHAALSNRGFDTISLGFPESHSDVHAFWHDIGLTRLIDNRPLPDKIKKNRFFELTNFRSTDTNLISEFVGRFDGSFPKLPDLSARLDQCLGELMENVRVHSQCPWGGYLCGYMNSSTKVFRFSIADFGRSIPGSLKMAADYRTGLDDEALLNEAMKTGISSLPGERVGSGFASVTDFVQSFGGILRLYSGNGCLRYSQGTTCSQAADAPYPGTLITIDISAV